jgi:hypothetical protein
MGSPGQLRNATAFDRDLALWRHESVGAALRFVDSLLAAAPAPRAETAPVAAASRQNARVR